MVNLNPDFISGGGTYIWCGCWDPFFEQWILGSTHLQNGVVGCYFNASYNGQDWFRMAPTLGNPTWNPVAMAVEPTSGIIACIRTDQSANWSVTVQVQGAASAEKAPTGSGSFEPEQGVMVYFYATAGAALKQWMFVGAGGLTTTHPWTGMAVSGAAGGATWTNLQTDLPSNWSTGTTSVFQWLAATDESYPGAGDPNNLVVAQCGYRPGTDKSYLLQWNQATPTTFTDITPAVLSAATYQIRGLAWSPVDQLWGMILVNGDSNGHGASPAGSYFYTPPDLVAWTLGQTFLDYQAGGLACNGNIWSIIFCSTVFTVTSNRVLFSNNVSLGTNQTWTECNYADTNSIVYLASASNGYPGRLFAGNGHQFLTAYLLGGTAGGPTFLGYAATSLQSMTGVG